MATIWGDTVVPDVTGRNETGGITCGTHFYTNVDGNITHLRLYRDANGAGVRTLQLWDAAGNELASVVGDETVAVAGWYNYELPAPVAITANTHYVVSYHNYDGTTNGRYATSDTAVFATELNADPLFGYQDNAGSPIVRNGTYAGGATPTFPTSVGAAGVSYYADVVFEPAAAPGSVTIELPLQTYVMAMPAGSVTTSSADGTVVGGPFNFRMTLHPGSVTTFNPAEGVTEVTIDVVNVANEDQGIMKVVAKLLGGEDTWTDDTVVLTREKVWEFTTDGPHSISLIPNEDIEAIGMAPGSTYYEISLGAQRKVTAVVPASSEAVSLRHCHDLYVARA